MGLEPHAIRDNQICRVREADLPVCRRPDGQYVRWSEEKLHADGCAGQGIADATDGKARRKRRRQRQWRVRVTISEFRELSVGKKKPTRCRPNSRVIFLESMKVPLYEGVSHFEFS
jgi:hypothetical protein